MAKISGWPVSLIRWVVLAACIGGLAAHLFIDSLGQPLPLGNTGSSAAQSSFAGLVQGDAHHDHFYLPVWQPDRQPVSRVALVPSSKCCSLPLRLLSASSASKSIKHSSVHVPSPLSLVQWQAGILLADGLEPVVRIENIRARMNYFKKP